VHTMTRTVVSVLDRVSTACGSPPISYSSTENDTFWSSRPLKMRDTRTVH